MTQAHRTEVGFGTLVYYLSVLRKALINCSLIALSFISRQLKGPQNALRSIVEQQ